MTYQNERRILIMSVIQSDFLPILDCTVCEINVCSVLSLEQAWPFYWVKRVCIDGSTQLSGQRPTEPSGRVGGCLLKCRFLGLELHSLNLGSGAETCILNRHSKGLRCWWPGLGTMLEKILWGNKILMWLSEDLTYLLVVYTQPFRKMIVKWWNESWLLFLNFTCLVLGINYHPFPPEAAD